MTLEWIVTSSVLLLLLIGLRFLLKGRISLRLQYGLWLLALLRLLLPFSLGSTPVSVLNTLPQDAPARIAERAEALTAPRGAYTVPETTTPADAPAVPAETVRPQAQAGHETAEAPATGVRGAARSGILWDRLARYVWLAGAGLVGLWLLLGNLRFALRLKRSRKAFAAPDCRLPVYVSEAVETPCLFGLFRPAVYLTPEAAGDEARLKHVLAHEETHFRHGDQFWSILRGLCLALHWFNPLVWWAAFLSRRDGELACDEAAIRRLGEGERAAYGRTLIGLTCEKRPALLLTATTMTGSRRGIKERILLLAKKPKTAAITLAALLLILAVAAGCTLTGRSAAANEPDFHAMAWEVTEVYAADRGITGLSETEYALWQEETGRYVDVVFPIGDGEQSVQVRFVKDEAGDWNMHVTTVTGAHNWSWQEEVYGDTPPAQASDEPSRLPATPVEALSFFFAGEDAPSLGLTWEGDENTVTEYSRYALTDWYEGRFDVLLGGWRWEVCELPDTDALKEEAAYWLTLGSADGNALLRLYPQNGGTLVYSVGKDLTLQMSGGPGGVPVAKNTAYRDGTPLAAWRVTETEGEGSILDDLRAEYDLLQVDLLAWRVTMGGNGAKDAEEAVELFLRDVGLWYTNLEPLNGHSLLDCTLLKSEIKGISEDGRFVLGSFLLEGTPKYPDSPFIWAGNTTPGEDESEGKVRIGREFLLQKEGENGWRCTDLGTGGVRLPEGTSENAEASSSAPFWDLQPQKPSDALCLALLPMGVSTAGDDYRYRVLPEEAAALYEQVVSEASGEWTYLDGDTPSGLRLVDGDGNWAEFTAEGVWIGAAGRSEGEAAAELYALCRRAATDAGVGEPVRPEDLHGIRAATLDYLGTRRIVYDPYLEELENMLAASTPLFSAACWFTATLTLELEDGSERQLAMATDSCGTWMSNGACYRYAPDNLAFFALFAPEHIREAAQQSEAVALTLLPEIDWSAYARVAGDEAAFKLMEDLENWCLGIPISATAAFEAERRNRLYFFMNSTGGLDGAYTDHFASVLRELYDAAPKDFVRVVLEELDEYHRSETLNLLAYALSCEPREALELLEAELDN